MRRLLALVTAFGVAAMCPAPSAASTPLSGFTVTSWSQRDGLPAGTIWALAQDAQGFLWIGCDSGVLRFDGSQFRSWESLGGPALPGSPARAILAHSDGSLWVGFDDPGGISRIREQDVRTFSRDEGLPPGQVRMLVEDPRGMVWAGTSQGLFRFDGARWHGVSGLPARTGGIYSGYITRAGLLVVGTDDGVYRKVPGEDRIEALQVFGRVDNGIRGITEDRHGQILATDMTAGFRVVSSASPPPPERGRGLRVITAHDGSVWVATGGHGVWRVTGDTRHGLPAIESAHTGTGLVTEGAFSLFEDRDGNIWAGTGNGLMRFTRQAVEAFTDSGVSAAIATTPDGRVLVATFEGLNEFARQRAGWTMTRQHFRGRRVRAVHATADGQVFAATDSVVARLDRGRAEPVPLWSSDQAFEIASMVTDANGRLWVFDARRGWFGIDRAGRVAPIPIPEGLRGEVVLLARFDRSQRLWLTLREGGLAIVDTSGTVRRVGPADGASVGPYRAFLEDSEGVVWLGGRHGLTRYRQSRFTSVSASSGFPADFVKAITEDTLGQLWLGTNLGIVRVSRDEYEKASSQRPEQWTYHILDKQDGVAGTPRLLSDRSGDRDADGGLWFVTGSGVTRVDPAHYRREPTRFAAQIVGVRVDGRAATPEALADLEAGVSKLEIDYSALNLTSPHRTRFRYRLDGFDREWVYADFRRTAFYTNLAPGDYRFQVAASESGSAWNGVGDTWTFSIRPHIYQTRWFPAAVLLSLALPIWGLWRLRAARMRAQFAMLLRERMRLSREIHDTLLQSMVGVALQCDVLAATAEHPSSRQRLTQLRRRVEEYIDECRQSIWDLRSPVLDQRDLLSALRWSGDRVTAGTAVELTVTGTSPATRPSPRVEQQLLRIAQEAVANAVRHASASRIQLHLEHSGSDLTLRIVDDGRGFEPDLRPREDSGHCGLSNMRERAREVNGRLDIRSAPGAGTEVTATVPFTVHARAS